MAQARLQSSKKLKKKRKTARSKITVKTSKFSIKIQDSKLVAPPSRSMKEYKGTNGRRRRQL